MSSIAGIYTENSNNAATKLGLLLQNMQHRGKDGFGTFVDNTLNYYKNIEAVCNSKTGNIGIGHSLMKIGNSPDQPLEGFNSDLILAFTGEIFNYSELEGKLNGNSLKTSSDSEAILHFFEENMEKGKSIQEIVKEFYSIARGEFAVALILDDKLYAFRDILGKEPLWFGCINKGFALASEPQALQKINASCLHPIIPGHLIEFSGKKVNIFQIISREEVLKQSSSADLKQMQKLLEESVFLRTRDITKAGLFFSGGIDSALLALTLKPLVPHLRLYTAGMENSKDVEEAGQVADSLGIQISIFEINNQEISYYADLTKDVLGFSNQLQLEIGIPEFIAAKEASKDNQQVVFSGQGADELFAGYAHFCTVLKEKGYTGVEESVINHCKQIWARNLYRDDIVSMHHSLELRVPYLDTYFVKSAISIPAKEKILNPEDRIRKHALRKLAFEMGIDRELSMKPKKAIQYSSGISKALR